MNHNYERARILIDLKKYNDALKYLGEALREDPNDSDILTNVGLCEINLNQFEKANRTLHRALEINPNDAYAHYLIAWGYSEISSLPNAEASAIQAVSLCPDNADYHALLAVVQLYSGKPAEAEKTLEIGLQVDPTHARLLATKAELLQRRDMPKAAAKVLMSAFSTDPNDTNVHATQGWMALSSGDTDQAKESFLEALRIEPEFKSAKRGLMHAQLQPHVVMWPFLAVVSWAWPPRFELRARFFLVHFLALFVLSNIAIFHGLPWWGWVLLLASIFKMPYRWFRDANTPLIAFYLSRDPVSARAQIPELKKAALAAALVHAVSVVVLIAGIVMGEQGVIAFGLLFDLILIPRAARLFLSGRFTRPWLRSIDLLIHLVALVFAIQWIYRESNGHPDFSRFVAIWIAFQAWRLTLYLAVVPYYLYERLSGKIKSR